MSILQMYLCILPFLCLASVIFSSNLILKMAVRLLLSIAVVLCLEYPLSYSFYQPSADKVHYFTACLQMMTIFETAASISTN